MHKLLLKQRRKSVNHPNTTQNKSNRHKYAIPKCLLTKKREFDVYVFQLNYHKIKH